MLVEDLSVVNLFPIQELLKPISISVGAYIFFFIIGGWLGPVTVLSD